MTNDTEESVEIQWGAPPKQDKGRGRRKNTLYARIRAELLKNPGEWAVLKENTKNRSLVYQINKGVGPWGPEGTFAATSRTTNTDQGLTTIWVKAVEDTPDDAA